ncbi:MAG: thermonuclease family protein [Phycisphaerae bacterium]|jgi:endonuclease YncB( thermonuclease family)
MKQRKRLIAVIVLAALSVCAATAYKFSFELPTFEEITPAQLLSYQVVGIIGGDTVIIDVNSLRVKVKMIGITPAEKYSGQLAAFTKNLLRGENVFIVKDPNQNEPNNAETISGYVYRVPDGLFVNAEIIRQGYGRADKTAAFKYSAEFGQLEKFARERGKGIWDTSLAEQSVNQPLQKNTSQSEPTKQQAAIISATPKISQNTDTEKDIVYVTKTGTKYHRSGCSFLSKSSTPIKLEDAKAKGYTPCSKCCKE